MADILPQDPEALPPDQDRVHFRIEFSVFRAALDDNDLSREDFSAWLLEEYGQGEGHPGACALLADYGDPVTVSFRYRTDTGGWDGVA